MSNQHRIEDPLSGKAKHNRSTQIMRRKLRAASFRPHTLIERGSKYTGNQGFPFYIPSLPLGYFQLRARIPKFQTTEKTKP
jgi:hypothetical protein